MGLLDHLIRSQQQRGRDGEPEGLGERRGALGALQTGRGYPLASPARRYGILPSIRPGKVSARMLEGSRERQPGRCLKGK